MPPDQPGTWWFHPMGAGTVATQGLRSLLEGAHLTPSEMFVREVTQNSVDARRNDSSDPVRMRFTSRALLPSQARRLRDFLCNRDLVERLSILMGREGFPDDGGAFARLLAGDSTVRVLTVEDFGTKGLGGTIGGRGEEDHFSRLVYYFGQSHGESEAGGAFGFGKSVYSVASSVRTVIYYSRPADGKPSRFISVSLLPGHDHRGRSYTGYSLCGSRADDRDFPILPLEGESADEMADAIGLSARSTDETGTSIMVLGCAYDVDDLRSALEKWWWPRIVTTGPEGLVVSLWKDGAKLPPANPAARADLQPFIQAYRHLLDGAMDTPDLKTYDVRSIGKRVVGKLVLKRVERGSQNGDEDESPWHECRVAMFRAPKLVVMYEPLGTVAKTPFVGVFVAELFMNAILRQSENPAHDTWAPESSRLDETKREPTYVRAIRSGCRRYVLDFQAGFDARPVPSTSRLHALRELLGKVLMQGTAPGRLPPAPKRPVSINIKEHRDLVHGYDEARIHVASRDGGHEIPARLLVTAHVLGDSRRGRLDTLDVEILDDVGRLLASGPSPEVAFDVPPEGRAHFVARSKSPLDSPVKLSITVVGRGT